MRHAIRILMAAGVVLCGALVAQAQVTRSFILMPGQVVPPSASAAMGQGSATLNGTETSLEFAILHNIPDPDALTVTAAVYRADWGSNGPAVFTLTYLDEYSISGTWAIDSNGLAALEAGLLYVQIDTAAHPNGALRGQIDLNPNPQPGDVIITEIMYDPLSPEGDPPNTFTANPEWIELFNTTVTDIQIGGWFFQDEDTKYLDPGGDPCELEVSGSFPDFVLRSFETVVVIPDGVSILGFTPSVAEFKESWFGPGGGTDIEVIQLNPDGTAEGALVGNNLSNNPVNDDFPSNDLPLDPALWAPCDSNGLPRADNDILTLNDGLQIIDVVNYGDDFNGSDWPQYINGASITLVPRDFLDNPPDGYIPGDFTTYNAVDNDLGIFWRSHDHGDSLNGKLQVGAVGVYTGSDIGSPGYLYGATDGNQIPAALAQQVFMSPGETRDITIEGADFTRPFFGLMLFVIRSLPAHGQLIDVASDHLITPQDVAGAGYLMPRIPFEQVRYINDGTCGLDAFTFSTHDGVLISSPAVVDLFVQCGDVVMTEIMYNPDSTEDNPPKPEWIELYNATDHPIDLEGWYIADNFTRGGDFPSYILGAYATVVAVPWASDPAEFEMAWPQAPFVYIGTNGDTGTFGHGGLAGSALSNTKETVRIVKPGGTLEQVTDAVSYIKGWNDPAWPKVSGESIYLPPPATQYDAAINDTPASWDRSFLGVDGGDLNFLTTIYDGDDIGSPGHLQGVTQGGCNSSGAAGDGNGDGAVDLVDFEHFMLCLTAPQTATPLNCGCFDADTDGDVDLRDYGAFQATLDAS